MKYKPSKQKKEYILGLYYICAVVAVVVAFGMLW